MSTGIPKDRSEAYSVTGDAITATLKIGVTIFLVTTIGYSLIHRFKVLDEIYSARSYLYPSLTPNVQGEKEGIGTKKFSNSKIDAVSDSTSSKKRKQTSSNSSSESDLDIEANQTYEEEISKSSEEETGYTTNGKVETFEGSINISGNGKDKMMKVETSKGKYTPLNKEYRKPSEDNIYRNSTINNSNERWLFSWISDLFQVEEDTILQTVGLDALVFIRMQRMCFLIFLICSIFGVGILLPTYWSSAVIPLHTHYIRDDGTAATIDFFPRTTAGALPQETAGDYSPIYRTVVAMAYIYTIITIYFIYYEYKHFMRLRFKFLSLPRAHNYSIMVSHVPERMRDPKKLRDFFNGILNPKSRKHHENYLTSLLNKTQEINEDIISESISKDSLQKSTDPVENSDYYQSESAIKESSSYPDPTNCMDKEFNDKDNLEVSVTSFPGNVSNPPQRGFGHVINVTLVMDLPQLKLLVKERNSVYERLEYSMYLYDLGKPRWCDVYSRFKYQRSSENYLEDLAQKILAHGERLQILNEAIQYLQDHIRDILYQHNVDHPNTTKRGNTILDRLATSTRKYNRKLFNFQLPFDSNENAAFDGIKETKYGSFDDNEDLFQNQDMSKIDDLSTSEAKITKNVNKNVNISSIEERENQQVNLSPESERIVKKILREPPFSQHCFAATVFLSFNSLQATSFLRQSHIFDSAFDMHVKDAPATEDIIWSNINRGHIFGYIQQSLSLLITVVLTFFFAIPVSIISAMNSYNSIMNYFATHHVSPQADKMLDQLNTWFETHQKWRSRVDYLLPLISPWLLLGLLALVPVVLSLFMRSIFRDARTVSECDRLLFSRYNVFLFYNAFLVYIITSSVMENLAGASVSEVMKNIGATLPKPAAFYLKFILIKGLMGLPFELIRSSSYIIWMFKLLFINDETLSNRSKTVIGLRSIYHPGSFPYGKLLSEHMLIFLLVMCYAAIAPVILPCGVMFFLLSYIVYKQQLLYVYEPEYESGGKVFLSMVNYYFFALLISQILLLCLLVTKLAYSQLWYFLLLPIITITAARILYKHYGKCAMELPINIAYRCDTFNEKAMETERDSNNNTKENHDDESIPIEKGQVKNNINVDSGRDCGFGCAHDTFTTTSRFKEYSNQKKKYTYVYNYNHYASDCNADSVMNNFDEDCSQRKRKKPKHRKRNSLDKLRFLQRRQSYCNETSMVDLRQNPYHHPVLRSPWLDPPRCLDYYQSRRGAQGGGIVCLSYPESDGDISKYTDDLHIQIQENKKTGKESKRLA